jgi:hypothetical protein
VHPGRVAEEPEAILAQSGDQRRPPSRVLQAHAPDVPFQVAAGQQGGHRVLGGLADPLAEPVAVRGQPGHQRDGPHQPADPH